MVWTNFGEIFWRCAVRDYSKNWLDIGDVPTHVTLELWLLSGLGLELGGCLWVLSSDVVWDRRS